MRFASDRNAVHAECKARLHLGECSIGTLATGATIGQDADLVAALDLPVCHIEDMTKNAANRRAHRVQDSQRIGRNNSHLRNNRSRHMRGR